MIDSHTSLSDQGLTIAQILESRIQSSNLDVPMLPKVAGRVVTLSQDPESDAQSLAQLIQGDQSLAAHVMRIANSASYSPNVTLVSLQQAITRLGIQLISEIALSASISTKMFNTPGFEQHIASIWNHALATALWAKEIARICRKNVEATFLCGLLHSIGKPAVLQTITEISQEKKFQLDHKTGLKLESLYHHEAGKTVAEKWQMPPIICESILYFHNYDQSSDAREIICVVNAGARIATHMLNPEQLPHEELIALPVFTELNLYQDQLDLILEKTEQVTNTMETMQA